jgi:hypothetical protein
MRSCRVLGEKHFVANLAARVVLPRNFPSRLAAALRPPWLKLTIVSVYEKFCFLSWSVTS